MRAFIVSVAAVSLVLAGCGNTEHHHPLPKPQAQREPAWHPATAILLAYAAPDGSLTRGQMETGLRRDFDKADADHDGCLDDNEVRVVNEERWKQDASTASPLIDFKHNGCVDFDEYAATARSLFDLLDRNGDGKLTPDELRPGTKKPTGTDQNQNSNSHHGHHQGGGGNGGTPPGQ